MVVKSMDVPILEEYLRNEHISQQISGSHPEEELDPDEDGMDGYEADIEDNLDNEEDGLELEEQRDGADEIVAMRNVDEISNRILDGHSEEVDPDEEERMDGHETDMEEQAGPDLEGQRNALHERDDASDNEMYGVFDGVDYHGEEIPLLVAMVANFPDAVDEL